MVGEDEHRLHVAVAFFVGLVPSLEWDFSRHHRFQKIFVGSREEAPARDYRATFTDVDGARIEVGRVTTGTDTTLEGDLGRGRLRVPFDNIEQITFKPSGTERDRIVADVKLREGEPVTVTLRSSTTFYGRVPSGA